MDAESPGNGTAKFARIPDNLISINHFLSGCGAEISIVITGKRESIQASIPVNLHRVREDCRPDVGHEIHVRHP